MLTLAKERELIEEVKRRLAEYPDTIIVDEMFGDLLPPNENGALTSQNRVFVKDKIQHTIDSTGMYKQKKWGEYKKLTIVDVDPSLADPEPPNKFVYVPKATMADVQSNLDRLNREEEREKEEKEKKKQRKTTLQDDEWNKNKNKTNYKVGKVSVYEAPEEETSMDDDQLLNNDDTDPLMEEIDDTPTVLQHSDEEEEIEEAEEAESIPYIEETAIVEGRTWEALYDPAQTIPSTNKTSPMHLINLVQFIVDEQPKSKRGASYIIGRENHYKLLIDVTNMYRGLDEDPTPDDLAKILKSWFEELEINDEITKSEHRAFCKQLVKWYYDLYHGVDAKLKRLLESL